MTFLGVVIRANSVEEQLFQTSQRVEMWKELLDLHLMSFRLVMFMQLLWLGHILWD